MFLACLWWPLPAATRMPMRARPSALTLLEAPESSSAFESHAPGGGALGSTALRVDIRRSRRITACACCACRSLAGPARGASGRGIQLRGATVPGTSNCDSTNTLAIFSRGTWQILSFEQYRLDRKQGRCCPAAWYTPRRPRRRSGQE